jgi:hypothetical protein
MNCKNPVRIIKNLDASKFPEGLLVPCGKCRSCRKAKSKEWSIRMLHELDNYDKSSFVTLTYNDETVPEYNSLRKADLQKFFKRLRKNLSIENEDRKIKYFATGEYGDQTQRPHYHAILYNIGLSYYDQNLVRLSWSLNNEPLGHVHFGLVEPKSIMYVAQYINKKFSGPLEYEEYISTNRENVFKLSSNGFGKSYAHNNSKNISERKYLTVNGVKVGIPRYYLKTLNIDSEELHDFAIEQEKLLNKKISGHYVTTSDALHYSEAKVVSTILSETQKRRLQVDKNLKSKLALVKSKI